LILQISCENIRRIWQVRGQGQMQTRKNAQKVMINITIVEFAQITDFGILKIQF